MTGQMSPSDSRYSGIFIRANVVNPQMLRNVYCAELTSLHSEWHGSKGDNLFAPSDSTPDTLEIHTADVEIKDKYLQNKLETTSELKEPSRRSLQIPKRNSPDAKTAGFLAVKAGSARVTGVAKSRESLQTALAKETWRMEDNETGDVTG
ncbi:hypothetical protein WN48_06283 [Eufriesea mexicana]|nr:hypothetical protein WN48_06283 [Eufriesea mexicana]